MINGIKKVEELDKCLNSANLKDPRHCDFDFYVVRNKLSGEYKAVAVHRRNSRIVKPFAISVITKNPKVLYELMDYGKFDKNLVEEVIELIHKAIDKDEVIVTCGNLEENVVFCIYMRNLNNFSLDTSKPLSVNMVGYADNKYNYLSDRILRNILEIEYGFCFKKGNSESGRELTVLLKELAEDNIIVPNKSSLFVHKYNWNDNKNCTYYRFYREVDNE